MVLEDEKVGNLGNLEKKDKKSNKNASTSSVGVAKADVKAIEGDLSFEEKKLSAVKTRKDMDKAKMETKSAAEREDYDAKRKREREVGNYPGNSSKDSGKGALKNVEKKKNKKLKERHRVEQHALLDTKTVAPASASESWEYEQGVETLGEGSGPNAVGEVRKRKREKAKREDQQVAVVAEVNDGDVSSTIEEREKSKTDNGNIKRRKREKGKKEDQQADVVAKVNERDVSLTIEERENSKTDNGKIRKRKKAKVGHTSGDPTHEKCVKRVRFSGNVQIFPLSSDPSDEKNVVEEENLLHGKRFSDEEDEIIKGAVYKYIEIYNLGEEGLQKVLNSKSNPEVKGCWKAIGRAIPYRPYIAVYGRAQVLFRRGENRKWTEEEYERILKFHEQHGQSWNILADELGKHQRHVRNTWLRIKLPWKKGHWTQEEYQHLFDLVNTDLQLKLSEEKKSRHGMLRDNIRWTAISDKLSTRSNTKCCEKWYNQLSSPMVASGEWANTDDYRLVDTLYELDASCMEDVDWDNLLDHRSGELCRKRWNQMVRHIGQHGNKSFAEQVEVLAKRYRPDLVEAREAWDGKPVVP